MDFGNGLYAQVVMINRRESEDKKGKYKTKNTTPKDNHQEKNIG